MDRKYADRIRSELTFYRDVESVHDLPVSQHYVNNTHLRPLLLERFGFGTFSEMVAHYFQNVSERLGRPLEVLSLGSGNCDFELELVETHGLQGRFTCLELNRDMLDRAAAAVREKRLRSRFRLSECDVNALELDQEYDLVIANYALHHFVELEHIFARVREAMHDRSCLLVSDMIGRNGHLFWEPTLDFCNRFWSLLPRDHKYNHLLKRTFRLREQWDCAADGFEGIRAQDILPLLDEYFSFRDFIPFHALVNRFTDRDFGPNFDPDDVVFKSFLDLVWYLDDFCCSQHLLKPTQLLACLEKSDVPEQEKRSLYFERPADLYRLEESRLYEVFDRCKSQPAAVLRSRSGRRRGTRHPSGWRARRKSSRRRG